LFNFFSFEEIGSSAQLTILKGLNLIITTGLPLLVGRCNPWKRKQPDLAILTLKGSNFFIAKPLFFRVHDVFTFYFLEKRFSAIFVACFERDAPREG
jgi:hypothetical protein